MNIGKAMQTIREENGLTRKDLAEKLGCTTTAIWKAENGHTIPKQGTIDGLCFVTKTPLARFYLLALEARDFAPYPSVKDVVDNLKASGLFSKEEVTAMTSRLLSSRVE